MSLKKKEAAIRFLDAKDYSLDGLLKIQEYFFDFSEKVVLITIEGEAQRNVQKLIAKRGGAREFCKNFVLPIRYWEPLEEYCKNGSFYKCSPEIREYKNTLSKLYKVIGSAAARALTDESLCK